MNNLGWVAVDLPEVLFRLRPEYDKFLAVAAYDLVGLNSQFEEQQLEELFNVAEQFLADALACTVYAQLHPRGAV